jgi:release factor glutamine methyltransferase
MNEPPAQSFSMNASAVCIQDLVSRFQGQLPRSEIHLLIGRASGLSKAQLLAYPERPLEPAAAASALAWLSRRAAGEPVAYLIGEREFFGLNLQVSPAVLIPRPDTEVLVEQALCCIAPLPAPRVLDLGTGSGAVALALASQRPDASVVATDISPDSLAVAQANGQRLGLCVQWHLGSWFEALPPATPPFDLIVSNPPYIAANDEHLQQGDLRHEPLGALSDGGSGLLAIEAIIAGAGAHLKPGGWLWLEHGHDQASSVRERLQWAGFGSIRSERDLAGIERVSGGCFRQS